MSGYLHPTSPTTDHAVKDLLDHRARASHTRYNSLSFSQRSDSPSIYSRGECSPSVGYTPQGDWPIRTAYPMSATSQDHSHFDDAEEDIRPPSIASFIDSDDRPPSVVDDEDEDGTSFISAPTPKPAFRRGAVPPHEVPESESPPTDDTEEDPRLSLLGPKMRFVSRAPWEMGEEDLVEEGEEDGPGATDGMSIFGGKMGSWRSKDQDKSSVKGLGLSTFRSRSPGPPSAGAKKGGFGVNFGLYRTKTDQSEGPYGPYLADASQSHSAVLNTLVSSSRSSQSVTDSQSSDNTSHRTPFAHVRSRPTSPETQTTVFPTQPFPNAHAFRTQNASYSSQGDSASSSLLSHSSPPAGRYVHPYANPDLLPTAGPPPSMPLPRTPRKSRDQSTEERERVASPLRRASESPISSPRPINAARKVSAGGPALPLLPSRTDVDEDDEDKESVHPFSHLRARAYTSPVPSPPVRSMMAYGDQPGSPMHNLISLEQAQARAQITPQPPNWDQNGSSSAFKANPSSTLVAGLGLAPGVVVDNGVLHSQTQRSGPVSFPHSEPPAAPFLPAQNPSTYQRPRTRSSGKHMFGGSAAPDGDTVPAKSLKHKKSAFMKLFQGGKDKERDREQLNESLTPTQRSPIRAKSTPPGDSSAPPPSGPHNIKRVPPPLPLSVVVTSPSMGVSGSPPRLRQGSSNVRPASPPRHRQASSPLPSSSNQSSKEPASQESWPASERYQGSQSSDSSRPAASAPPTQTTFATLSLRPVSTIFSAQFPDLLTPSSPPTNPAPSFARRPSYPSPTTPAFSYSRSNSISTASDYPVTPTSGIPLPGPPMIGPAPGEDQSGVITTLQEQLVNSCKTWQRQVWELEGQVKDLKSEVEELRNNAECETCGKARREGQIRTPVPQNCSVVDRPRPRMGRNARSVFGGGGDM